MALVDDEKLEHRDSSSGTTSAHEGGEEQEPGSQPRQAQKGSETQDVEEAAATTAPSRPRSRASSAGRRPAAVTPRNKRRGLFARLAIIPEVEQPYDYSNRTKWTITAIVALSAAGAPFGAGIFYRESLCLSLLFCPLPRRLPC